MLNIISYQGARYHFIPTNMAIIKKRNSKCWWGYGEIGASYTSGGTIPWCSHFGKQLPEAGEFRGNGYKIFWDSDENILKLINSGDGCTNLWRY